MRIQIRDTTYDTVKEAAEALGVSTSAIYNALGSDTLDSVGMRRNNGRKPVYGYPSITAAAEAMGVSRGNLSHRITKTGMSTVQSAPFRRER